jgi:hypothetical protein
MSSFLCHIEGCAQDASLGAKFCQQHWQDSPCAVRSCEAWARSGSFLCERHDAELRSFGRTPLFAWLEQRASAPLGPREVPGLGASLTTHGLPSHEDPTAALETALLEAGMPHFITPARLQIERPIGVPLPPPAPPPGRFTLLSPNRMRFSALIQNDGPAELCIEMQSAQLFLPAEQIWQVPNNWLGPVYGFWCGPKGIARATELSVTRDAFISIFAAD